MVRKSLNYFAPRTCTITSCDKDSSNADHLFQAKYREILNSDVVHTSSISTRAKKDTFECKSFSLENLREIDAYVLLGAPGMGKTEAFKLEGNMPNCRYITVRDFVTLHQEPESATTTLFLDALDEKRIGQMDGRTALDEVRYKLQELGFPRFRLSCREVDWFGASDNEHLKTVSPNKKLSVFRLKPLTKKQVCKILNKNFGISNPTIFVALAKNYGVDELLYNPQMLEMLANAVSQSSNKTFPRTRFQTFELACRNLLKEHNQEHQVVNRSVPFDSKSLLETAGKLCAIQILSGVQGYALSSEMCTSDYPDLEQIINEDGSEIFRIVHSKLFHTPRENCIASIHRQVAEFLAALYLGKLINDGLPLSRVLSLMTGFDDLVVSELRGLSAWLTLHCASRRKEIMARDPFGVLLYGDAKVFSNEEKVFLWRLLRQNSEKDPRYLRIFGNEVQIGDILTEEVVNEIREYFRSSSISNAKPSFDRTVIDILRYGTPVSGVSEILLTILKDNSISPKIRLNAIDAFVHQCADTAQAHAELKDLLDKIYVDKNVDPDNELIDRILNELYPGSLKASEILKYFRLPSKEILSIDYEFFWGDYVPQNSTANQLAYLLNQVEKKNEELKSSPQFGAQWTSIMRHLSRVWLRHYLDKLHGELDRYQLFEWLGFASGVNDWHDDDLQYEEDSKTIASWIERRPELHLWLLGRGLENCIDARKCSDSNPFSQCINTQWKRTFGAAKPKEFGLWCVSKALEIHDEDAKIWLLHKAVGWIDHYDRIQEVFTNDVTKLLERNPDLKRMFSERRSQIELVRKKSEEHSYQQENKQRQKEWQEYLKPHETALQENRIEMQLLSQLALVYLGGYLDVDGRDPISRLSNLVGDDNKLLNSILEGLRESINRDDVPSDDEVIELHCESKRHLLVFPILAGLNKRTSERPDYVIGLKEKKMRLAVALYFTEPYWRTSKVIDQNVKQNSQWFPGLLRNYPDLVADVLFKYASACFRSCKEGINGLYELAYSKDHKELARLVSLRLLRVFPLRCRQSQLQDLRNLLSSALNLNSEKDQLVELIERKLSRKSMDSSQRVYWLVAGLLISSDKYVEKLDVHITNNKNGLLDLERCLVDFIYRSKFIEHLNIEGTKLLIRYVGSICHTNIETTVKDAADCVREMIERLASNSSVNATTALQELADDDNLIEWRSNLLGAAIQQERKRRESEYHHSSTEQVIETLQNCKPANPADLAALVEDKLRQIANEIRNGSASGWRQYWNVDHRNRPEKPKHENACRDRLMWDLQQFLCSFGIDVQPEGTYAEDKRADIRVFYNNYNVPVELKKSSHRDVWSAILNQLVMNYTRDPGTDGYGIYVVFWFGFSNSPKPTPGIKGLPKSSEEFERILKESLPMEKQHKISVSVIDVSLPDR